MDSLFPTGSPGILDVVASLREPILSVFPGAVETSARENVGSDALAVSIGHQRKAARGLGYNGTMTMIEDDEGNWV